MIKDKPNVFFKWFATVFVERFLLSHFATIKYIGELNPETDRPSLVLMNHYSLNDGAILHRICRTILKKDFKVMTIEKQFKSFPMLKYIGCFSVNKKSRDMIESLNYAAELLHDPNVALGIYPQAGLFSMHLNKIHFESGIDYIAKRSKDSPYQVFFGVSLLDYLESFKPIARVYLKEYHGERISSKMEDAYNQFYRECKQQQQRMYRAPEKVVDQI